MKKTVAILFLSVHLWSTCGYRLFFSLMEIAANRQMVASLDNNSYNEEDLMQIKFALNMPYITGNTSYERCNGKVEYNGVQYNYVKRVVTNDTLYLYCIPNQTTTAIKLIKTGYAKENTDNAAGKKTEQSSTGKNSITSESSFILLQGFNFNTPTLICGQPSIVYNRTILKGHTTRLLQPPDVVA